MTHELHDHSIISKLNFAVPTMCFFRSENDDENGEKEFFLGIAYQKEIICLCCGAVCPMDEVAAIRYNPDYWANFNTVRNKLDLMDLIGPVEK